MDTIYIDERASGPAGYPISVLFLGCGLAYSGVLLLHSVLSTFALIFSHDWTYLTTPDAPGYDPFWKLVVGAELLMSLLMTALLAAVLVSLAQKRKAFVRLTMLWMMACVPVAIRDALSDVPAAPETGLRQLTCAGLNDGGSAARVSAARAINAPK
jgi:hypothetical protein